MFDQIELERLLESEKKYLANKYNTNNLKILGFSIDDRVYLRRSSDLDITPRRPRFLKGNTKFIESDYLIETSNHGLTYAGWRLMMLDNPGLTSLQRQIFTSNFPITTSTTDLGDVVVNVNTSQSTTQANFFTTYEPPSSTIQPIPIPFDFIEDAPEYNSPETNQSDSSNPNSTHNLTVKWSECYGIKGDKVFRAYEFSNGSNSSHIYYRTIKDNGEFDNGMINDSFDSSFDFTLPKLGLINYENHIIQLIRNHKKTSPSRYRKGLRPDGIKYVNLSYKELGLINQEDIVHNIDGNRGYLFRLLSYSIFFPKTYTYEQALASVLNYERLATAFSSSLAIRLDSIINKIVIQKHQWVIGHYNPKTSSFDMLIDTFNDDLLAHNIPINPVG